MACSQFTKLELEDVGVQNHLEIKGTPNKYRKNTSLAFCFTWIFMKFVVSDGQFSCIFLIIFGNFFVNCFVNFLLTFFIPSRRTPRPILSMIWHLETVENMNPI